jgi:hypothetical protein
MTTRRSLLAGAALLAPLGLALGRARAAEPAQDQAKPQFLFVQNAEGIAHQGGVLTLKGVSPLVTVFSDRPERIAGHMTTESFVPFWGEGADSFAADPPNATLSVLDGSGVDNAVVELRNPRLHGKDLSYEVKVLEGRLPDHAGPASLFIDIIGMPLTPLSFAGARRRMWRRAVIY